MAKTSQKALDFVKTAIDAAKLSIEMFNRVEPIHWKESVLILNAQSWELLLKGYLIKKREPIYETDGKTISAEKALNRSFYKFKLITKEQAKTIGQIVSLRNEAMHNVLPIVDDEILTHLMYFSITTFNEVIKNEFRALKTSFEKNYLSIALGNHTFYSNKVEKLFKHSRKKSTQQNQLLYLLDRGCEFIDNTSANSMKSKIDWDDKIRRMPKKSRMAYHLSVYDYISNQDNVRIVPVHVAKGYSASMDVHPSKNPNAPVIIKKTDPNKDYPHFTSDLARILGKHISFISKSAKKLKLRENEQYCYLYKTKSTEMPKYSDKALNYLKNYIDKNPDFNPYSKK
jgi:hypothetical protein